jgi:peptidyl-prolyl cis-trans isomerase A (cyclophilin A)
MKTTVGRLYKSLFIYTCILVSCSSPKYKNPHIEIQTRLGDIEIELFADKAPKTVANFLSHV